MLLLPGASLLLFYPDLGCRPMGDLELLVRPGTAVAFRVQLAAAGFAPLPRHPGLWTDGELAFDLHEELLNAARIRTRRFAGWMDPGEVWADRHLSHVEGAELRVMGPEDTAPYTAVHALRHSFGCLTWLVHLQLLLWAGLDWGRLKEKARRYNLVRPLVYGLLFLGRAGGWLPDPAEVLLERTPVRPGKARLLGRIYGNRLGGEWGDGLWAYSIPSLCRRCWFLLETCFPQPKVLLQVFPRLPALLFPWPTPCACSSQWGAGAGSCAGS
ncbi:MAG: nucleotidyltransferase family protein [Candidatus Handelsmanbacteria bacterium]|nr:nucleotidyltransferase family protein [Candidatus Handelsmanbacteria bacterium]